MWIRAAFFSLVMSASLVLPASAQFGRVERSDAEIKLAAAQAAFKKAQTEREAAESACEAADISQCYVLGEYARQGLGGDQDFRQAARAYRVACAGKSAQGCAGLAYLTTHGRGVTADTSEARRLYERSCTLGEVSGCAAFGNMLYAGEGGRKDVDRGTRLLREACISGYQWACQRERALGTFERDNSTFERLKDLR